MTYTFDWGKLSPEMRLGSSPNDRVILYRGFDPAVEDSSKGFSSVAYDAAATKVIEDAIHAVSHGGITSLAGYLSAHTAPGVWKDRGLTPFVSATPEREIAERYARNPGERVATIVLEARQVVLDAFFAYEALVIGNIDPEQIVAVEKTPVMPAVDSSAYAPEVRHTNQTY